MKRLDQKGQYNNQLYDVDRDPALKAAYTILATEPWPAVTGETTTGKERRLQVTGVFSTDERTGTQSTNLRAASSEAL